MATRKVRGSKPARTASRSSSPLPSRAQRSRRNVDQQDLLSAAAAYLAGNAPGDRVRTQKQIGKVLGVPQPKVSVLLANAKSRGWFVERVERKYDPIRVGKQVHEQVLAQYGQDEFLDTMQSFRAKYGLGKRAPRLHVLEHSARKTAADFGHALPGTTDLAVEAAAIVAALLAPAQRIGVCWGYHIGLVISALAHMPLRRNGRREVEVVPLAGEPFEGNLNRLSSTSLAQELMTALNGKSPQHLLSLTLVPAVRPDSPQINVESDFDKYLHLIPGYRLIFGTPTSGQSARINGLDAILTGVSHAGFPWGRRQRRMYPDQTEFKVLANALGDIGGVLLPGGKAEVNKALRALQDRWTGLQPKHLKELALRAANAKKVGPPGVICIAAGESKAPCCMAALQLGYVNHMIVDKELGDRLMKMLAADAA